MLALPALPAVAAQADLAVEAQLPDLAVEAVLLLRLPDLAVRARGELDLLELAREAVLVQRLSSPSFSAATARTIR
jgi:hypothetical protein